MKPGAFVKNSEGYRNGGDDEIKYAEKRWEGVCEDDAKENQR